MTEYQLYVFRSNIAAIFNTRAVTRDFMLYKTAYPIPDIKVITKFGDLVHIMERNNFFQRLVLHEILLDINPPNVDISEVSEFSKSDIRTCTRRIKELTKCF